MVWARQWFKVYRQNKANLRDLIAATRLLFLLEIGSKSLIIGPMWPGNLMETSKTIGHLLSIMSSFMDHFKAIGEFEMELQSGNTKFWAKISNFLSRVTFKFDRWHWKTIGHHFYATWSVMYHFIAICEIKMKLGPEIPNLGQNRRFFVRCDLEISQMTLKKQ